MICDRQHACLHENLTELEQCRRLTAAPSRAADNREFRVTTKDQAQGRQAAPRRRIPSLSLFPPIPPLAYAPPAFAAPRLAPLSPHQFHPPTPPLGPVPGTPPPPNHPAA